MQKSRFFSYRTYCILGDGESAEGSVWEAANFASFYKLDNLVAIVDVNRLGQSDPALLQHDMNTYQKRWEAFGLVTTLYLYGLHRNTEAKPQYFLFRLCSDFLCSPQVLHQSETFLVFIRI